MAVDLPRVRKLVGDFVRPHYVYRPTQLARRAAIEFQAPRDERVVTLPWGAVIAFNPHETVGMLILRRGIYDVLVCESLLRLADIGETALDLGANIGQMSSLLAHAVGSHGRVIAFEPHPVVFAHLQRNVEGWTELLGSARIELHQVGASNANGTATLATDHFDINQGSASFEHPEGEVSVIGAHEVEICRLDDVIGPEVQIGVMKMDVEGHELSALEGAHELLSSGWVRDILFEERDQPPTPITRSLESHGYTIIELGERLIGPTACRFGEQIVKIKDEPSLLATREPERALQRLRVPGWAIYNAGPARRFERARRARQAAEA